MQLMNVSTYSCADTSLGCSCDNCPDVCSNSGKKVSSIGIWPIEVSINAIHIHVLCLSISFFWDMSGRVGDFHDLGKLLK